MQTVGEILRETRVEKLLSLEDVEKHTKIRKELLEALEKNDYDKLPPATFVQGFIKNYGKYLNLNVDKLLALFRRDYETSRHPAVVLESFSKPLGGRRILFTPSRLLGIAVTLIILSFFGYLWLEYRQFVGSPNLTVNSPQDQQTVDIPTVVVSGRTDPETKVLVNNQSIGVDKEGNFKEEVKLSSSNNTLSIVAISRFGQSVKIERTVFVKK